MPVAELIFNKLQKAMKMLSLFSCSLFFLPVPSASSISLFLPLPSPYFCLFLPISAYTGLFRPIFANKFAYLRKKHYLCSLIC